MYDNLESLTASRAGKRFFSTAYKVWDEFPMPYRTVIACGYEKR